MQEPPEVTDTLQTKDKGDSPSFKTRAVLGAC